MQRNKQGAFAVEALSDDNKVVGIKHFAGTHNGVKRTEASVIKHNVRRIDARRDKVFAHGHRFVIALQGIVAAEQQVIDFTAIVSV